MKRAKSDTGVGTVLGLALGLLMTGCEPTQPGPAQPTTAPPVRSTSPPPTPPSASGSKVKREMSEAAQAALEYLAGAKDQVVASIEKKLAELDLDTDQLKQKAAGLQGQAKAEADEALNKLREQRQRAAVKLDQVKSATTEAWEDLKVGLAEVLSDLDKAWKQAKDKLR